MVAGYWTNQDGLPLQYGVQKAIPELGGDFLIYGDNREIECYISLANTQWGSGSSGAFPFYPAVPQAPFPASPTPQTTPIQAGVQSMTALFPLQTTTPVTTSNVTGGGLFFSAPQVWIDTIEVQCLVTANAGSGGATGLTGIGLVYPTQAGVSSAWAQVAPNAGVQFLGSITNAAMTAGATYTFRANANNTAGTGGAGYIQYSTANTATVTAGSWLGNVPITTSFLNGSSGTLATEGVISAFATAGTYSGTSAAGLLKLRIKYNLYGAINQ